MGWWSHGKDGNSFSEDSEMVWGDSVADIVDNAIMHVVAEFKHTWDRPPTLAELEAGFKFSTNVYEPEEN